MMTIFGLPANDLLFLPFNESMSRSDLIRVWFAQLITSLHDVVRMNRKQESIADWPTEIEMRRIVDVVVVVDWENDD